MTPSVGEVAPLGVNPGSLPSDGDGFRSEYPGGCHREAEGLNRGRVEVKGSIFQSPRVFAADKTACTALGSLRKAERCGVAKELTMETSIARRSFGR